VAGAGYDAHVITKLPTRVPSRLAYLKGAVSGLASYRSPRFRISADETIIEDRLLLAFVANGQFCGNRMHVAPRARVDDGLLDLVTVQNLPLLGVLSKLGKLYRGSILGDPAVKHLRSSRIRIDAAPVAQVEADGQLLGPTPVECSVCPSVLRVAVP
jgi:diacylglycerol kinase family enzyme